MIYSEKYNGYIADNPNIDFERCDGEVFNYYEVNTASMSNTANTLTITGGQGNYPLAYIDTDRSLEFTFASSQFSLDMFEMANASSQETGDYGTLESKRFEVETGTGDALNINIPYECQTGSVKIRGLKEATTLSAGHFTVAITAATAETDGKTVVTLNSGDAAVGDTVRVSYRRRMVGATEMDVSTRSTTAKGSLYAHWPIYSAGTDCTEASIKAWLHLYLPRVRVTALPGFDNSYKSAATNAVTFAAIDPKRPDEKMYSLYYEPLDANGNIVAKSSEQNVDWD